MTELIDEIKGSKDSDTSDDEGRIDDVDLETTSVKDIQEFNAWAKSQILKCSKTLQIYVR